MKRKWLALLLACLMISSTLFAFSSCSSSNDEITVWIGGSIVGEDELEESQDSWIISQLLQEYEELNDVKIKLTYFEDEEAMVQLIANNGRSDNEVPDIACARFFFGRGKTESYCKRRRRELVDTHRL